MGKAIIIKNSDFFEKNVGQVTFSNIPLESLAISGESAITNVGIYIPIYTPSFTTEKGVVWSIVDGNTYASINSSTGEITVLSGASNNAVTIRCTSLGNPEIYAEKNIFVTRSTSVNNITPVATETSLQVNLSYSAASNLTITVTQYDSVSFILGTISIAAGDSSGSLSFSASGATREIGLSVSPSEDTTYIYSLTESSVTIPASVIRNLMIVGPAQTKGDVRAGNYFILDCDAMKQVVGTSAEVTDEYKEYIGPITWGVISGAEFAEMAVSMGTEGLLNINSSATTEQYATIQASVENSVITKQIKVIYNATDLVINDFSDLQSFANALNNQQESTLIPSATNGGGFENKHIRLGADMDYNNQWVKIGHLNTKSDTDTNNRAFKGWFDGAGFTIKNIGTPDCPSTPTGSTYMGGVLFQLLINATVSNFRIEADLNIPSTWAKGANKTLFVLSAVSFKTNFERIFINTTFGGTKLWQIGTISRNDTSMYDNITDIVQAGYYEGSSYAWGNTTSAIAKRCTDLSVWKAPSVRPFYCSDNIEQTTEDILFMGDLIGTSLSCIHACQKSGLVVRRALACGTLSGSARKFLCGSTDYSLSITNAIYESGKTSFTSSNGSTEKTKAEIQSGSLFNDENWIESEGYYPIINNQFAVTSEILRVAKNGLE